VSPPIATLESLERYLESELEAAERANRERLEARVEAMKADVERLSMELEAERSARRAAEAVARGCLIESEALRQRFRQVGAELDELISNIGPAPRSVPHP
jgi:anti-sigma factor RsiW